MKGKKVITYTDNAEEVKRKIMANITYYNGHITSEDADGFTFKKSIWTSKSNPLKSVSKGEIKVYKELEGVVVEYDLSEYIMFSIIVVMIVIISMLYSTKDIMESMLIILSAVVLITLSLLYNRYRILKLLG